MIVRLLVVDSLSNSICLSENALCFNMLTLIVCLFDLDDIRNIEIIQDLALDREDFALDHEDLALNHEDLTLNHEDLASNHEDLALDREDFALDHEDLALNHEDLALNHEDLALDHEDLALNHEDLALDHEDLAWNHEDLVVNHEDLALNHEDLALNHENLALNHEGPQSQLRISSSEPTALSAGLLRSEISGVACLATFRCRKPEITWLRTPFRHEGRWGLNRELLIPGRMVHYWTGHSARHTLDIGKEKRDFLGRWAYSQHGSQDYVLTSRQVVHAIQNYVCKSLIVGGYIEEEVLSDLEVYAKTCGLGAESLGGHHVLRWDGVQRPWALGGTFPAFQVAGQNRAEVTGDLDAETKEPFNK
ncbi:hypothetical protein AK812_SmicGene699 [Symbiodinium microadriaticum]|uniref:Uncharacterized protein n=1 Tax=Symbiodinium microadriaticum TaxID=2951 RepID=A0A1Q9F615_SYMMI|nr:hypothetical protein AK812_SmicGene699 [Symbiodinium microadriaticum]